MECWLRTSRVRLPFHKIVVTWMLFHPPGCQQMVQAGYSFCCPVSLISVICQALGLNSPGLGGCCSCLWFLGQSERIFLEQEIIGSLSSGISLYHSVSWLLSILASHSIAESSVRLFLLFTSDWDTSPIKEIVKLKKCFLNSISQ